MKKSIFCLLWLTISAFAVPPQLIKSGRFETAPDPRSVPGIEEHGGAWIWNNVTGKQIPDWEITGKVALHYYKRGPRLLDLNGGTGTIYQDILTEPGHWYYLTFYIQKNGEGGSDQTFFVAAGSETHKMEPKGSYWVKFKARTNPTRVTFSGKARGGGGPYLSRIRCIPFDPEAVAVRSQIESIYRELDRTEKDEARSGEFTKYVTEDFSWQPSEGQALSQVEYQERLRQLREKHFKVNTAIQDVTPNEDGTVTIEVERRQSQIGDYGKIESDSPHFKHTWVKIGKDWKLKRSEEVTSN
jgi:hypothetical protein